MTAEHHSFVADEARRSLREQLFWLRWLAAVVVVVPLVLFGAGAAFERAELFEWARGDAQDTAALLGDNLARSLDVHTVLLRQVERLTRDRTAQALRDEAESLEGEFRALADGLPYLAMLEVAEDGRPLLSIRTEVAAARAPAERSGAARAGSDEAPDVFTLDRPASGPPGSGKRVIRAGFSIAYYQTLWPSLIRTRPGFAIALLRDDGAVVGAIPPSLRLATAGARPGRADAGATPPDDAEHIYASVPVAGSPFTMLYGVPRSVVLDEWWRNVVLLGMICGGASVLLAVSVQFVRRQVVRIAQEEERRRQLESSVNTVHRFEMLGELAAGVAHDFANIIQSIYGGARLLGRAATDPDRVRALARQIEAVAEQGGAITRKMLEFAHGGDRSGAGSTVTIPAEALAATADILDRLLGRAHTLHRAFAEEPSARIPVQASRSELESAVMNLVINARDAMPVGGTITLAVDTRQIAGEAEDVLHLGPGTYCCIRVSDTGHGMPPEVLARASEAFFTTKQAGKGTGLGLSSVRAFAEHAGGGLRIESTPGTGTAVTIWLRPVTSTGARTGRPSRADAATG